MQAESGELAADVLLTSDTSRLEARPKDAGILQRRLTSDVLENLDPGPAKLQDMITWFGLKPTRAHLLLRQGPR